VNLPEICRMHEMPPVDAVVCGLPWASFSETLQGDIFEAMFAQAAPDLTFATFAYWQGVILPAGRRFSRRLRGAFSRVRRSHTVWRNLPPAFVYRCAR
ncbi:MAG: SAM-dependent methyltransferase, partial [Planctomycetota bacterium]